MKKSLAERIKDYEEEKIIVLDSVEKEEDKKPIIEIYDNMINELKDIEQQLKARLEELEKDRLNLKNNFEITTGVYDNVEGRMAEIKEMLGEKK